jgi:hypothetical protein
MGLSVWSVLIGVAAGMASLLILLVARARRVSEGQNAQAPGFRSVAKSRLEEEEAEASGVAEEIEELANRELSAYPDVRVDFGTAPDGGLEIWVGPDRYGSVDEIADARVREAVVRAVAKFNR